MPTPSTAPHGRERPSLTQLVAELRRHLEAIQQAQGEVDRLGSIVTSLMVERAPEEPRIAAERSLAQAQDRLASVIYLGPPECIAQRRQRYAVDTEGWENEGGALAPDRSH